MKKFLLVAGIAAVALVSLAGCNLYGKVNKVTMTYTLCNYTTYKFVTKTVFHNSTAVNFNVTPTSIAHGYDKITDPSSIIFGDNSLGLYFGGPILNPNYTYNTKIMGTLLCEGFVRIDGNASYDFTSTLFSGTGHVLVFLYGNAPFHVAGKPDKADPGWNGVVGATTITPSWAYIANVNSGTIVSSTPATAAIHIPAFKIHN